MPLTLLFDLDGTITDSRPGIVRCIAHALEELGRPAPADSELTRFVGPPLAASFQTLLGTADAEVVERAIALYRERFDRVGIFENTVYPGMHEALAMLAGDGHYLAVVTAKPRAYAVRIIEHFGLAPMFRSVHGPDLAHRHYTKAFLIEEALASAGPDRRALAMMIGDRTDDIDAAREACVRATAVTWGYGTADELRDAMPDAIVDSPQALVDHVVRSATL